MLVGCSLGVRWVFVGCSGIASDVRLRCALDVRLRLAGGTIEPGRFSPAVLL